MTHSSIQPPEVGQAVQVRNRLATVRAVQPYDSRSPQGLLHIVDLEYLDDSQYPESEQLLWEIEKNLKLVGRTTLPSLDERRPDHPEALQAFIDAHRWTRLNRLRKSDDIHEEPLLGVWNSAIQVHPYQLEPVIRALSMPRVSLLLADGVGLGKTIQAGLVLEELLLRRRIRRILVLCPALLQRQWKYELKQKFNLNFEIIDSDAAFQLRRRMGIDANPWKAFPRIIASMDYLRMPDVLHQFQQASGAGAEGETNGRAQAHAPWDLLIVDECHHFAPQSGQRASQRTRMMREIRFLFEHRIFLSATPHNGKTVSFTGLLELLDPIRFQMDDKLGESEKKSLDVVRIRRLKEDINKISLRPPFADQRPPEEIPLKLTQKESALYDALREYRKHGQAALANASASERWLGQFIYSLLTKRLLSCPYAFARTWGRHLDHDQEEDEKSLFNIARASAERAEEQTKSDDERSIYEEDAAHYSGAFFRSRNRSVDALQQSVQQALYALGFDRKTIEDPEQLGALATKSDSKTDALVGWIKQNLFDQGELRNDERLIVFTEYKETLFYLERRLLQEGFDANTLKLLYGGMNADTFESVKSEFEDPNASVRLLLATDAASEGINMQECCRWVIHYDVPWSPSKIVQRNGRVSRHGQVRDVSIYYFRSDEDDDLKFLAYVAQKVSTIQDELGSVEPIFDEAIQRHFEGMRLQQDRIDRFIEEQRHSGSEQAELGRTSSMDADLWARRAKELLESTESRLGITPWALENILRTALKVEGQGALEDIPGRVGFFRLNPPPNWESLARQTLSTGARGDRMEICFDAVHVEEEHAGRRLMRLRKNQTLLRLGHPIMRRAMAVLCRQLHDPSGRNAVARWSIAALHRSGIDVLLVLYYTLTAVNELREPLHDEVLTKVFRVEGDDLTPVEAEFERSVLASTFHPIKSIERQEDWTRTIRSRWYRHRTGLEAFMQSQEAAFRAQLEARAQSALAREREAAKINYRYRIKELQERSREKKLEKMARALMQEKVKELQPALFEEMEEDRALKVREIEEQIEILRRDVNYTRERVLQEQERLMEHILPRRYTLLKGSQGVRALPLALTYLIKANAEDLQP